MEMIQILLILTILAVVVFDFTNGFHDSADMIATAIASRSMKPSVAIILVSIFTFIAPFIAGLAVADTVGGFVDIKGANTLLAELIVLSSVTAAITYNIVTWKFGLPSSSSISLVGGLVGAGLYGLGEKSINWGVSALNEGHLEGVAKIVAGLFISPIAGFIVGFVLIKIFIKLFSRLSIKCRKFFVFSQYLSVSWLGFSHGANDAQKGMAIIAMVLFASKTTSEFIVPVWVIILCTSAITLGTIFGGWSIIKTLGFGIIKVKILESFTDQIGAAFINTIATIIGTPTSTTQVVTSTLLGIGAQEKPRHVRWKMAISILKGWLFNIPVSIILGASYCMIFLLIFKG